MKSVEGSESLKVIVALSPALRVARSLAIATVGWTVLILIAVASPEAALPLPAASPNRPAATLTVPSVVEEAAGVKVAQ